MGAGDTFFGGDGNDRFFVQTGGGNSITGGEGEDQFWIAVAELPDPVPPNVITDFTTSTDVIGIAGLEGVDSFEDLDFIISNSPSGEIMGTSVVANGDPLAFFQGVALANADDFVIL